MGTSHHTRALFYKRKKEREVEITMDRPTLSSPPKDFSPKEELSTSTTTQTTATRGVGEKFQSLSIDFFGNKCANDDDDGLTTTRNTKKKNARSARGRMKREDGHVPSGFRAVHGEPFPAFECYSIPDEEKKNRDEKKKKKIFMLF